MSDVLDQFSASSAAAATAAQSQSQSQPPPPAPSSSGPGRPVTLPALPPDIPIPTGPTADESESDFLARLTAEMSAVMSKMSVDPATGDAASPEDVAKMGRELEEFTQKMEAEGVKPEDLLQGGPKLLENDLGKLFGKGASRSSEVVMIKL